MTKYSNYKIIESQSAENLIFTVGQFLEQGWEPVGGIAISVIHADRSIVHYAQAIAIKKESKS